MRWFKSAPPQQRQHGERVTPVQLDAYRPRHRMTTILLPEDTSVFLRRAQDMAMMVSVVCEPCEGRGRNPDCHPYCGFCLMEWTVRVFNVLIEKQKLHLLALNSDAPILLPCGHPNYYLKWTDFFCEACKGSGYVERWVDVAKLREHMREEEEKRR